MDDRQRLQRHMTTAQRELRKAVERAQDTQLRPGHYAKAARRALALRDATNELLSVLDGKDKD